MTLYQLVCLLILIQATCGLLSEFKICGDAECESRMSRVQAIQDHHSKDCRFLSFRQGDVIFVYHKLTGMREDLWAGSIDRKFGYFPKDAVKEEEIYATTEKVLETQRSDFFCVDENGYPIDTSELDNNENMHLPETTQTIPTRQQNSLQESHQLSINANTNTGQEEDSKEVQTENEKDGSPSWLRSSVTGLWDLVQKDETNIPEEDRIENIGKSSLSSSVNGWFGFGAKHKEKNSQTKVQDTEGSSILGSSMTDWLSFGLNSEVHEKDHTKRVEDPLDDKSGEVFRGRKIAVDLQGENQFHTEDKKETGALGWIGNGISSTLGLNTKETRQESTSDEAEKELNPVSNSWFDIGITNMLGFRNGVVNGNEVQKDSSVVEPEDGAPPNIISPKQQEVIDTEHDQREAKNSIKISFDRDMKEINDEYNHNESETVADVENKEKKKEEHKQVHKEGCLNALEARINENELSQMNYEAVKFKDPKDTDENTALSTNKGPSHDSQVIHDQDKHIFLEMEQTASSRTFLTENAPDEAIQSGLEFEMSEAELPSNDIGETIIKRAIDLDNSKVSERETIQSNMGQEIQDKEENREDMGWIIKVNDIQETVNEKQDMSTEITESKQDSKKRPNDELQGDGIGETVKIFENLDEIKKDLEQGEVGNEENENKLNAGQEEQDGEAVSRGENIIMLEDNSQESAEEPREDEKHDFKDEVAQASDVGDMPKLLKIHESNEKNVGIIDQSNIKVMDEKKNDLNEKENRQLLFTEYTDIQEKVHSRSNGDLHEIVFNNDQVLQNNQEITSQEEIKADSNETEPNVYEERVDRFDVKEENSVKLGVDIKSSIHNSDLNIAKNKMSDTNSGTEFYRVKEETEVTSSKNVLTKAAVNVLNEPTDIDRRTQSDDREGTGHFNNAINLVTRSVNYETIGINSETVAKEAVNGMIKEDTNHKNNAEDLHTISPSTQYHHVQSTTPTTLNPKTLQKLYHNILTSMNAHELEILIHHFGEHKMQFLDYILASLETATGDHEADISILLDIQRLLNHHMKRLMIPSTKEGANKEEKEKSGILIALQKLELVLEKVKKAFHLIKAEQEQDVWISKDKEMNIENKENLHELRDMLAASGERHNLDETTNQVLDFFGKTAEDAFRQIDAAFLLITWLSVQVYTSLRNCTFELLARPSHLS